MVEDTLRQDIPVEELPTFRRTIYHKRISGSTEALRMNFALIMSADRNREFQSHVDDIELVDQFRVWLINNGFYKDQSTIEFVAAGKNFSGFDLQFLKRIPSWGINVRPRHRVLDPAILYFDSLYDEVPPSLSICLKRAGLDPFVKHDAVDDAMNVIRVLRHAFATRKSAGIIGAS